MRPQDPFIGKEILNGQFQVLQKIGSGGMGSVYKSLQKDMNRMVAVKILHPKLANRSDLVSRFRREARAMSQLTHPNTVRVFLYGELEEGSLYIVMEYLDGKNLNQMVRTEGAFQMQRALPILIQVCGALEEAHRAGIIHRDLKPENIFLCQQGGIKDFPKVLDFGLAKMTERQMRPGSVILTQEGMVFGTPEFMSPEQAQGKSLTPASDLYSLAVILYEVLTGKLPFDARNAMDFLQLHVTGQPVPLNRRVPGKVFPELLERILDRALAKRPEARFASAADFATALQSVLAGDTQLPERLGGPSAVTAVDLPTVKASAIGAVPGAPPSSGMPPQLPVAGDGGPAKASRGAPPRVAPQKVSVGMLVGIAVGFMALGVGLAIAVMMVIRR